MTQDVRQKLIEDNIFGTNGNFSGLGTSFGNKVISHQEYMELYMCNFDTQLPVEEHEEMFGRQICLRRFVKKKEDNPQTD